MAEAATNNIQQQITSDIFAKFIVPKDFVDMVFKKAISLAKTTTDYGIKNFYKNNENTKKAESGKLNIIGNRFEDLFKPKTDNKEQKEKEPNLFQSLLKKITSSNLFQQKNTEKDFLQEEEKPKTVLIGGFTNEGYKDFTDKMPSILKGIFDKGKLKEEKTENLAADGAKGGGLLSLLPSGLLKTLLPILGGASLILGGLAALVGAFMTQGPAKGTLELIGKAGLKGGLIILAKKLFGATLKTALKKIPIIGTLISYGFAIQRFTNGDKIGGIIDLVSGTVQLLDLVAPGLGTVLSLGVDILQAVLDAKAGGSSAEASAKKGTILLDWAKGLGSLIWKGLKYLPVVGPLFDAYDAYQTKDWGGVTISLLRSVGQMSGVFYVIDLIDTLTGGNLKQQAVQGANTAGPWLKNLTKWFVGKIKDLPFINSLLRFGEHLHKEEYFEALKSLGHSIPFLGTLLDWLGLKETNATGETIDDTNLQNTFNLLIKLKDWVQETIVNKITGWVTGIYDWGKEKLTGLLSYIPGFSEDTTNTALEPPKVKTQTQVYEPKDLSTKEVDKWTSSTKENLIPMADGGIVTQPTTALIGEAGTEAVIPLDKYLNPEATILNNSALEQIVSNTKTTNDTLKNLSNAIFKLAQKINDSSKTNNIIVAGQGQKQQETYPSASQIAASNVDPIRQVRAQFAI